ncbi:MAG: aspartyl/asparaginyl beta-hydroxylase domain-containing protein [Gammaproteobacteria bacterium]
MLAQFFALKFIILYIYIASVAYTQFRGKVRLKFMRQIVNHSTFMSPINALMYLFSAVPNKPFFDIKQFPQLATFRDNWQTIRSEAEQLVAQGYIKIAENNDDMGFNSFFKRGWKRFYLKWYDDCLPSAKLLCPKTVELIKSVPGINGAMFTLLPKNGQLKPHRDPYAGSIRYHLGLVTPNSEKCRIYVDGIPYVWKDGEDVLFDETYIHSAKNETDIDRIIFFCDVERPMRNRIATAINRFFSKYFLAEAATQNLDIDRLGFFNRMYKHYHYFAMYMTRLKKTNKYLFKIVQYAGIAGLGYLIFFR